MGSDTLAVVVVVFVAVRFPLIQYTFSDRELN